MSIDLTPREKICCFTYFLTPKLNFPACSKKTSRFSLNRLDYLVGQVSTKRINKKHNFFFLIYAIKMLNSNGSTVILLSSISTRFTRPVKKTGGIFH